MQVEQALVDALLQVQGILHGLECALSHCWVSSILMSRKETRLTPALQEHQALGCLAVLVRAEQEEAVEVLQAHIITVEVEGHGQALEGVNSRAVWLLSAASHSRRKF